MVKKKSKVRKKKQKKVIKKIWANCSNRYCKTFSEMYSIPVAAVGSRVCPRCKNYLMAVKYVRGKPVMPDVSKLPKVARDFMRGYNYKAHYDQLLDRYNSNPQSSSEVNTFNENNSTTQTSGEKSTFEKLLDGELDLATAFWGYGVVGTMIVGVISGWLSGTYSKWFVVPYIIFTVLVITGLWKVAENYKAEKTAKKESVLWGILTQAFCVMGGLGLFSLVNDTFF